MTDENGHAVDSAQAQAIQAGWASLKHAGKHCDVVRRSLALFLLSNAECARLLGVDATASLDDIERSDVVTRYLPAALALAQAIILDIAVPHRVALLVGLHVGAMAVRVGLKREHLESFSLILRRELGVALQGIGQQQQVWRRAIDSCFRVACRKLGALRSANGEEPNEDAASGSSAPVVVTVPDGDDSLDTPMDAEGGLQK